MTLFYSGYDMYTCTWMHAMKSEILVPQHAQSKMLKFIQTDCVRKSSTSSSSEIYGDSRNVWLNES